MQIKSNLDGTETIHLTKQECKILRQASAIMATLAKHDPAVTDIASLVQIVVRVDANGIYQPLRQE